MNLFHRKTFADASRELLEDTTAKDHPEPKNDLERYFYSHTGKQIWKWLHYFEIYDRHFSRFRNTPVNVLEIGVWKGGSMGMWKWYFGDQAQITGIDHDPSCKAHEEDRVKVIIGDQSDRQFLRSLAMPIDILIDDGSHMTSHQRITFEELFPKVSPSGVYLIEDLHTSYWKEFEGGYLKRSSFIEYSKHLIDQLNAWHSKTWRLNVNAFTQSAHSLHYYDSVLVIEKRPITQPHHMQRPSAERQ